MLRQPACRVLQCLTYRDVAEGALFGLATAFQVDGSCGSRYTSSSSTAGKGTAQGERPVQCKITQHVKGHQVHLHVTGRSARDFILEQNREPIREGSAQDGKDDQDLRSRGNQALRRLKSQLESTFLPVGYPNSVGPNYLEFALWQSVTNFATTANGVLASTFLLYSVGLGAGAIPTAGALNWVLKDGLGQVGTLLFGKAIAHNFDIHSKSWYFLSCVLICMATGLEILTMLVPNMFLVLGSIANMVKGLSWMAGGSTRSVFNLSFVRDNNIADITAKGTSQYIFASLFGTAAGVTMCANIGQSASLALMCFSILAYAALYSAFRTVKSIPLPTLNSVRLQLLTELYLRCIVQDEEPAPPPQASIFLPHAAKRYMVLEDESACDLDLPTPLQLADADPPMPWLLGDRRVLNPPIWVGTPLQELVAGNASLLVVLMTAFKYNRYILLPSPRMIHIIFHQEASGRDIVQAYLQACILRKRLKTGTSLELDSLAELRIILHDSLLTAEKLTNPYMLALSRRGWLTEKIVVEAERKRAVW